MMTVIKHEGKLKIFYPYLAQQLGLEVLLLGTPEQCKEYIKDHE